MLLSLDSDAKMKLNVSRETPPVSPSLSEAVTGGAAVFP
jgi:hypothetical protein